ncbi:MAG: hypothetical protein HFF52_02950 [Lawsonibacter sp.]|nr:hypothetical protein [Lawsonibacter sp.]
MTYQEFLVDMEEPIKRITDGINAVGIMTMGLAQVKDPYADGFYAIWNYLVDAEQDLQTQLTACQNAEMD